MFYFLKNYLKIYLKKLFSILMYIISEGRFFFVFLIFFIIIYPSIVFIFINIFDFSYIINYISNYYKYILGIFYDFYFMINDKYIDRYIFGKPRFNVSENFLDLTGKVDQSYLIYYIFHYLMYKLQCRFFVMDFVVILLCWWFFFYLDEYIDGKSVSMYESERIDDPDWEEIIEDFDDSELYLQSTTIRTKKGEVFERIVDLPLVPNEVSMEDIVYKRLSFFEDIDDEFSLFQIGYALEKKNIVYDFFFLIESFLFVFFFRFLMLPFFIVDFFFVQKNFINLILSNIKSILYFPIGFFLILIKICLNFYFLLFVLFFCYIYI